MTRHSDGKRVYVESRVHGEGVDQRGPTQDAAARHIDVVVSGQPDAHGTYLVPTLCDRVLVADKSSDLHRLKMVGTVVIPGLSILGTCGLSSSRPYFARDLAWAGT